MHFHSPCCAYNTPQQTVHHPHKLGLQEPELELELQYQLCRNGWRHGPSTALPRHKTYTCTHMHANQIHRELAPVLATSKLLG
jgi:hypothetical protein